MKEKLENREMYFDYLRIIAIFCVIGIHIVGVNWYIAPVNGVDFQILNVYDSLFRFCVPIFIMISGALFINQKKEVDIKKLYLKNILRLVIALLFWSLAYSIFENIILTQVINITTIKNTILAFFRSHYHLWFLTTLIGLYMSIPILRKICENKKLEEYFLILSFIFTFVINFLGEIPIVSKIISGDLFNVSLPLVTGYTGYFLLGHYLNTYKIDKKKEIICYILGILSLIFTIIASSLLSIYNGKPMSCFYGYLLPNTYFVSISLFLVFKYHISKIKISTKLTNVIVKISKLTFGVYLTHDFFIIILKKLELLDMSLILSLSTPLIAILIFFLSLGVSFAISKIPLLNKYII